MEISLRLDARRGYILGGDWLTGDVQLDLQQSCRLAFICISFTGICELRISNNFLGKPKTKPLSRGHGILKGRDAFLELKEQLFPEGRAKETLLPCGRHQFPFAFQIPTICENLDSSKWAGHALPPSLELPLGRGEVRYEVQAKALRAGVLKSVEYATSEVTVRSDTPGSREITGDAKCVQTCFGAGPSLESDPKSVKRSSTEWQHHALLSTKLTFPSQPLTETISLRAGPYDSVECFILKTFDAELITTVHAHARGVFEETISRTKIIEQKDMNLKVYAGSLSDILEDILLPSSTPPTFKGATFDTSHMIKIILGVQLDSEDADAAVAEVPLVCELVVGH